MPSYSFNKLVTKITSLQDFLLSHISYEVIAFDYSENILVIHTFIELDTEQLEHLNTLVNDFVEPDEYLLLNYVQTDFSSSDSCNSLDYSPVKHFIHPCDINNGIFNTYKMIIEYSCISTTPFDSVTNASMSLSVFCETRQVQLTETITDISTIINEWKTKTGPQNTFKTISINGFRQFNIDYDTIRTFKLKVSDSNITVRMHTLQSLFYNPE